MRVLFYLPLLSIMSFGVNAAELAYSFNSPSFNGVGYSSHVLAIEQLQTAAQQRIRDQRVQAEAAAQAAQLNNPVNQFIGNFESIVYQQLAKQLSEALFGQNSSNSGTLTLGGNTIMYLRSGTTIKLTITDPLGTVTQVQVPAGSLAF
jgi:hypothetical protein